MFYHAYAYTTTYDRLTMHFTAQLGLWTHLMRLEEWRQGEWRSLGIGNEGLLPLNRV